MHLKCGGCVGCVGCVSLFPPLVEDLKLCPGNGLNVVYDGPSKRQLHPKKMTHGRLGRRDSPGVKAVLLKRCIANCSHVQSQLRILVEAATLQKQDDAQDTKVIQRFRLLHKLICLLSHEFRG